MNEVHGREESASLRPPPDRLIVVLSAEVGNQLFALHPAQRVFELPELNKKIVLGVQAFGRDRALVIEREPLLNATEPCSMREIHEECQV